MSKVNISPSTASKVATVQLTEEQQKAIPELVTKLLEKRELSSLSKITFAVTEDETLIEEARASVRKNAPRYFKK